VLLSAAAPLFLFCILILHSYFAFLFCAEIARFVLEAEKCSKLAHSTSIIE
jgi:cytochrome b subunit of formate dehydrogenase